MGGDKPKRRAIIVGINKYQRKDEESIQELTGAENDAQDISQILNDSENPEFDFDIYKFIGKDATHENIRKALSDVFWKTDETCDLALFYFSGHGFEDKWHSEGYIAPFDFSKKDPFVCGIKMSELKDVISKSAHQCTITILDCCYSGLAITKGDSGANVGIRYEKHVKDFYEEGVEGRIVLASSAEDQTSRELARKHEGEQEEHSHGAFTYYLIEGLDNGMTLNELIKYVSDSIKALGTQQCRFHEAGVSGIGDIKITRSRKERFVVFINRMIDEAENFCKSDNPQKRILAVDHIHEVLRKDPKNEKALSLKNEIINALTEYKGEVEHWLFESTTNPSSLIQDVYQDLEELKDFLDYDRIRKLVDTRRKILLINLCQISTGKIPAATFEEKIRQYLGPSSTQKKDIAAVEKEAKVGMAQKSSSSAPGQSSLEKMETKKPKAGAEIT